MDYSKLLGLNNKDNKQESLDINKISSDERKIILVALALLGKLKIEELKKFEVAYAINKQSLDNLIEKEKRGEDPVNIGALCEETGEIKSMTRDEVVEYIDDLTRVIKLGKDQLAEIDQIITKMR